MNVVCWWQSGGTWAQATIQMDAAPTVGLVIRFPNNSRAIVRGERPVLVGGARAGWRPSTMVRRLDAFEGLQTRANLYRDVLQVHVDDLENTLAGLTASVETLLNQKAAA